MSQMSRSQCPLMEEEFPEESRWGPEQPFSKASENISEWDVKIWTVGKRRPHSFGLQSAATMWLCGESELRHSPLAVLIEG